MLRVYYDPAFLRHLPGGWHPESPARLEAILEVARSFREIEIIENCRPADRASIELIHSPGYCDFIYSLPDEQVMIDPDTGFSSGSLEAALKAAGAAIESIEFVMQGEDRRAFCAVRPPGHHAEIDRARGFCLFNNIAIGAASAARNKLVSKVVIVDWDVHHGNGTQQAFYENPDVFYISTHQYPFFPGTGAAGQIGAGKGEGSNLNVPMPYGANDNDYRKVFNETILPAVDGFAPDLILLSAGFDAHRDDPLAGLNLSSEMYGELTKMLVDLARKHCYGRLVAVLEGGYNLVTLKESVQFFLQEMING